MSMRFDTFPVDVFLYFYLDSPLRALPTPRRFQQIEIVFCNDVMLKASHCVA